MLNLISNQHICIVIKGRPMTYKVFVYGTLRKGCGRNGYLASSKWLGEITLGGLRLSWYRYPVIIQTFHPFDVVRGDLYEIDESIKKLLDEIENPGGYFMELVDEQQNIYCYLQRHDWQDNAYPLPLNDDGEQEYTPYVEKNIYKVLGLHHG